MKNFIRLSAKILISSGFIYIIFKQIDTRLVLETLRTSYLPLALISIITGVCLALLLCLRWYILLKPFEIAGEPIRFKNVLSLTMVGLFFNNFLPSGSGGDIAKAFYLVRGKNKKLLLGSSVLMDRYIGACTIVSMGFIVAIITQGPHSRITLFLALIMACIVALAVFFSNRRIASAFNSFAGPLLPEGVKEKLGSFYIVCSQYFSNKKSLSQALAVSLLLQLLSVVSQYVMGLALTWRDAGLSISLSSFFVYIPMIWIATLIPSLGGLGVREYTYVFFFAKHIGEEKAFALSMAFLLVIVIQSLIGAVVFITLKNAGPKR